MNLQNFNQKFTAIIIMKSSFVIQLISFVHSLPYSVVLMEKLLVQFYLH